VKKVIDEDRIGLLYKLKNGLSGDRKFLEPSIVCVGIGGGGCNIVSELSHKRREVNLYCLNTDALSNAKRSDVVSLNVGADYIMNNRDSGGYVEVAKKAFKEESAVIDVQVLRRADLVLVVTTLGGGTGTGGTVEMVKLLKSENTPFKVFAVRPFEFEDNRKEVADRALAQLRKITDHIEVYDNNEFETLGDINSRIKEDMDTTIESQLKLYDTLYGKYSDSFDRIVEETLAEVLTERVLSIELEVEPAETEITKPQ
jgi:cell division GTPase FtsZ